MKNKTTLQNATSATLIMVLLLLASSAWAQPYQPVIASDSTSWVVAHGELFGIVTEDLYTNKHPDSAYAALFLSGLYPEAIYAGKVREDANTGKVWYTDIYNNAEKLIMDMGLGLGDSFEFQTGTFGEVDSVFYLEGRKIIRFDLETQWDERVMFIEGVGPNIGMFYPVDGYDSHYAACKYNEGALVYVNNNANFDGCVASPIGLSETPEMVGVRIFPNPASSYLHVGLPHDVQGNTVVQIADIAGRIFVREMLDEKNNQLDVSWLRPGTYLVMLTNGYQYYHQLIILTN